jgi:hypothetical protein
MANLYAWYHIAHNNFLVNIRLSLHTSCPILCCCVWKPINWLICKFGLGTERNGCQYICVDKCGSLTTFIKYLGVNPYMIVTTINL